MSAEVDRTVRAYDLDAAAYASAGAQPPDSVRADIAELGARLGAGARVLEIGSGGGRDALLMEQLGLSVRRTDITPAFVTLLRGERHDADLLDPLVDDLSSREGEYDAVWANASLLHVDRAYLATDTLRAAVEGTGWTGVDIRSGIAGKRSESWLELAAVRG